MDLIETVKKEIEKTDKVYFDLFLATNFGYIAIIFAILMNK